MFDRLESYKSFDFKKQQDGNSLTILRDHFSASKIKLEKDKYDHLIRRWENNKLILDFRKEKVTEEFCEVEDYLSSRFYYHHGEIMFQLTKHNDLYYTKSYTSFDHGPESSYGKINATLLDKCIFNIPTKTIK